MKYLVLVDDDHELIGRLRVRFVHYAMKLFAHFVVVIQVRVVKGNFLRQCFYITRLVVHDVISSSPSATRLVSD